MSQKLWTTKKKNACATSAKCLDTSKEIVIKGWPKRPKARNLKPKYDKCRSSMKKRKTHAPPYGIVSKP
jgi:hypothetical protein